MDMYKFLKDNQDKYCFYHDKCYGKIPTPTKYESNRLYMSIDDGTGNQQDLSAIMMKIVDNSDIDCGYIGGSKTVYSFYMPVIIYSSEYSKIIPKLIRFIKKIPKKSRNKLIKALYLYDKKEEKDFYSYERLFSRLSKRMGLSFGQRWITNEEITFNRIGKTYSVIGNRNRKLNKLLRNRKCI